MASSSVIVAGTLPKRDSAMASRSLDGFVSLATPAAELTALALSVFMLLKYRKRYGY